MPGEQKSILSYLKPKSPAVNQNKRSLSDEAGDDTDVFVKKVKTDGAKLANNGQGQGDGKKIIANEDALKEEIARLAKTTPALSDNIGLSWYQALKPEFQKKYFMTLSAFIDCERKTKKIFPPRDLIYSWTRQCNIRDVKVVILGQDPYHNDGQAHGLCFSVPKGVQVPPSLLNIYNELSSDIPGFRAPSHGNLTGWAKQGVLLLNAVLTVQAHRANSHADHGWEQLTDAVIRWLDSNLSAVVFLLWGAYAQVS